MDQLSISFSQAQQIAAELKTSASARQSELQTLGAKVNPDAVWTGSAASAYKAKYEQWRTAELNLINALQEMGQVVGQIVNNFQAINENGAAAFRG